VAKSSSPTPASLAKAKLASSGLTLAHARTLGIRTLTAAQTVKLFPARRVPPASPSLHLVYHDLRGAPRTDVYRVRLLEPIPGRFGTVDTATRYLQPPDTPPAAYLPRCVDWVVTASDPTLPVVVTEGELKAACAAVRGLRCIGLGGVWSWRSKRRNVGFLPELEAFAWEDRPVTILYDSDLRTNPNVASAVGALVRALRLRGAKCRVAFLPEVDGFDKVGLDDYVVAFGDDALVEVLRTADDDELALRLWELNERFCLVENPGCVYDEVHRANGFVHSIEKFQRIFGNQRVVTVGSKGVMAEVSVPAEWLKWPLRRTAHAFTFVPDGAPYVKTDDGRTLVNAWTGWGCDAIPGDVTPWSRLLDLLFAGADPAHRTWFERWCLYPIAHPGAKCESCVGVWSRTTGQGKSLVGLTLRGVYGDGYVKISQRELESRFNEWQANRQLVMVDDVSAYDSRAKADVLKSQITSDVVPIEPKGITRYFIPDRSHFYLTSNRANALYIEPTDRRYFVHEVTATKLPRKFYREYHAWLAGEGPAALRHYASTLDFGDFDPTAEPPMTRAKREMIDTSMTELELWLAELADDPDGRLVVGQVKLTRDLYTPRELLTFYDDGRTGRSVSVNVMLAVAKQWFPLVNADGGRLRTRDGLERFLAVRNAERWSKATDKACAAHVETERARERGERKGKY
jgi:hypothetical protein